MNPFIFRDLASLDAALERAQRLWPDPFEAPEVPPRELLEAYRRGPEHLPAKMRGWLPAQIIQSVNCQLALEVLRAEEDPDHILHPLISPDEEERLALQAWNDFKDQDRADLMNRKQFTLQQRAQHRTHQDQGEVSPLRETPSPSPSIPSDDSPREPAVDQVWTTKADLEVFNGQHQERRRIWRPIMVLLSEGPIRDSGEAIWRAMPCTPLWVWGEENVGDSEAVVIIPGADEYVVHFRLEYLVSALQLHACIGTLEDREITPGAAATTPELTLERERIIESAAWLTATADARREALEAGADVIELNEIDVIERFLAELDASLSGIGPGALGETLNDELAQMPAMAAAGGEPQRTAGYFWAGPMSALLECFRERTRPSGLIGFRTVVKAAPRPASGRMFAQWAIEPIQGHSPGEILTAGARFVFLDRARGMVLGHGVYRGAGTFELLSGSRDRIKESQKDKWALLFAWPHLKQEGSTP